MSLSFALRATALRADMTGNEGCDNVSEVEEPNCNQSQELEEYDMMRGLGEIAMTRMVMRTMMTVKKMG